MEGKPGGEDGVVTALQSFDQAGPERPASDAEPALKFSDPRFQSRNLGRLRDGSQRESGFGFIESLNRTTIPLSRKIYTRNLSPALFINRGSYLFGQVVHRALPDLQRMKLWYFVTVRAVPWSLFLLRSCAD
jgi:hypothetical protein